MRRKIVAGNWKMNKSFTDAETLINEIIDKLESNGKTATDVIICPPALYLEMASDYAEEADFSIGAQDVSAYKSGAYTGEIAAVMLQSIKTEYCIIGHSERRKFHHETNEEIAKKTDMALQHELTPIVCCGELLEDREANRHFDIVKTQIEQSLFGLDPLDFAKIIVAYEPVWAIGTGRTATPEQAQEMHAFIRNCIEQKFGKELAKKTPILYGGSCNPKNAKELFAQEDVDGGLIGGASLIADDFVAIANAF